MTGIDDFFNTTSSIPYTPVSSISPGYQSSQLDLILVQAQRAKLIKSNNLLDCIQLESDPHYNKQYPVNQNTLNNFIQRVSQTTQIMTLANSLVKMTTNKEFIPSNTLNLIYNYQTMTDASISFLSNIQRGQSFQQISNTILVDITQQFTNGYLSFSDIALMESIVSSGMPLQTSITNGGILALLTLPLAAILPVSMTSILSDASYLALLNTIFEGNQNNIDTFNASMRTGITSYSRTPVQSLNSLSTDYSQSTITLNDPLGIATSNQLQSDILIDYNNNISNIVSSSGSGLTTTQLQQITTVIQNDAINNVQTAFASNLGLPSISRVNNGIVVESYNGTVTGILNSFQTFTLSLISQLGLQSPPADTSPVDYLINLQKNIEFRQNLNKYGANTSQIIQIESVLKSAVPGGDISQPALIKLQNQLNTLLNNTKVMC